ncbi:MAG: DUF3604 domain-containing protein [Gammaproteobacteria bacterium]|nr:DUF3604 domain-containing protein [Gammaproteobacteria bacterium]
MASTQVTDDYLDTSTREAVEELKRAIDLSPTSRENARDRARLMWQWVNAYSLQGDYVPVNLTQVVSTLLSYPLPQGTQRFEELDGYVRELALRESNPSALGTLKASGGPFAAGSLSTLTQTYTVGTKPIQIGGGFFIAKHFLANHGRFQVRNPQGENFVSIASSNPEVSFVFDVVNMRGMHGGFRRAAPSLFARVVNARLEPGDVVTITYGDTSKGGKGMRMPTTSSDKMPFPVYVALNSDRHFLSLPIQEFVIRGGSIDGVHGFVPSIVQAGDAVDISVRAQDRYFNRASGELPEWHVSLGDLEIARIPRGSKAITVIENVSFEKPGVYRLSIRSADGSISGTSNPVLVETTPKRFIYWGDTHGHSGFAEGIGTPDRLMTWARDDARLDFVTHSEHDIWMDDFEWKYLKEKVEEYSEEGEFIAFLGYEWTVRKWQGGHHNVLFRTSKGRKRIPAQTHGTLSKLYQGLREAHDPKDVVVIPHAHQPADYRHSDPELEPLVEIMSLHGTFEWFARMYLQHGHQVGFIAASDDHLSQPGWSAPQGGWLTQRFGLGALRAEDKSRDSLFDAMRNLSTYATSGDRIILDFEINGAQMGQRIRFAETREVRGRVIGTAPIRDISVVKNAEVVWSRDHLLDSSEGRSSEETYHLVFWSDSVPFHPLDNPRGHRVWQGKLSIEGATMASLGNATDQALRQITDTQAEFRVVTRGSTGSFFIELENITEDTTITVHLTESTETGSIASFRANASIPARRATFELSAMKDGLAIERVPVDSYDDHISLRRIRQDGIQDVSFEFTDTGAIQGDYYYVRVRQANDAIAWSSPIWIGGYPKQ